METLLDVKSTISFFNSTKFNFIDSWLNLINIEEGIIENIILYNILSEYNLIYSKSSNIYYENHKYIKARTRKNFLFQLISCRLHLNTFFVETTYSNIFEFENSAIQMDFIIIKERNDCQTIKNFSAIQVSGNESNFLMNNSYIFNQKSLNGAV